MKCGDEKTFSQGILWKRPVVFPAIKRDRE
jgi:hypothetical protein